MTVRGAGPITGLLVGALLAGGGFLLAFRLGKPIRDEARASASWPATDGRITRSRLDESRKDGTTRRSADIGYEYEVAGRAFAGTRVWIGDEYTSSPGNEFRAAVERHPVGRPVRVHYDPADPARSVLEPGGTWSASALYLAGLGVLGLGVVILASAIAPLLFVLLAGVLSFGSGAGGDERDRFPPRPRPGARGRPDAGGESNDDDGIRIT